MRFATVIGAVRSRLATQPSSSPAAAAPIQPQSRPTAHSESTMNSTTSMYEDFLISSPLAHETSPALVDLIAPIFNNELVQRAAGSCAAKRLLLVELAGFRSEISAAIEAATANSDDLDIANVTPAMVAEVLRQREEVLEDAIAACREDRALHDAASRARLARHKPLRDAVSKLLNDLVADRDRLIEAEDAATRAAALGLRTRYSTLISAGLTPAQIEATEPDALAPEVLIHRRRARLAEIEPQISKLQAFGASATFDAALLTDFPEFAGLIAARDGNDGVKACQ